MGILKNILNSLGLSNRNDQEIGMMDHPEGGWAHREVDERNLVEIEYGGLLKEDGADRVYFHYAFDNWNHPVRTIPMDREESGRFRADIMVEGSHELNFCFKDSADHWDNNSGWNWALGLKKH